MGNISPYGMIGDGDHPADDPASAGSLVKWPTAKNRI